MEMCRYNLLNEKNCREIVLLKSYPCKWGKCVFCDYILDNSQDTDEIIRTNREILKNITGKHKKLEVINSASCFELPQETLQDIKKIIKEKGINNLILESHWMYRYRLKEMQDFFGIPIVFKCGIETFNDEFRNDFLKKGIVFHSVEEVSRYYKSVCLMVGIKGQTKEMIRKDIQYLENFFDYGCINIFVENSTPVKKDKDLVKWFKKEYSYLEDKDNIEVLWNNTDFGVGEIIE